MIILSILDYFMLAPFVSSCLDHQTPIVVINVLHGCQGSHNHVGWSEGRRGSRGGPSWRGLVLVAWSSAWQLANAPPLSVVRQLKEFLFCVCVFPKVICINKHKYA